MATKLQIWNKALRHLGLPRLATLTDNIQTRFEIEDAWATVPAEVIESGYWQFATVTSNITPTSGSYPGYTYTHSLSTVALRVLAVGLTTAFDAEMDYRIENNSIHTNATPFYLRYVSALRAADDYVTDWPPSFVEAVALRLAWSVAPVLRLGDGEARDKLVIAYREQMEACAEASEGNKHRQHRAPPSVYLVPMREMPQGAR